MTPIIALLALSALFDFSNGLRDGSNFVATMISTQALSFRKAFGIAAAAEFFGPFIFGVAVARTFGRDIVKPDSITINVLLAALISAVIWNLITWYLSIPSSSTHALLGGMIGAVFVGAGVQAIQTRGIEKILISLFISPPLGLLFGFLIMKAVLRISTSASPQINGLFKNSQILTGIVLALSYGANDAQKTMGLIALGLVVTGWLPDFSIPLWVIALSAGAISLGIFFGGQRMVRTLGGKFYKIRPVEGFSSQLSSVGVILGAGLLGGPVSSSQVVTTTILGAGSARRINKVRWQTAGNIAEAWLLTIPLCAGLAACVYVALNHLLF